MDKREGIVVNSKLTTVNGDMDNFTIRLKGVEFNCGCHCNVFHRPNKNYSNIYKCNLCGKRYNFK